MLRWSYQQVLPLWLPIYIEEELFHLSFFITTTRFPVYISNEFHFSTNKSFLLSLIFTKFWHKITCQCVYFHATYNWLSTSIFVHLLQPIPALMRQMPIDVLMYNFDSNIYNLFIIRIQYCYCFSHSFTNKIYSNRSSE